MTEAEPKRKSLREILKERRREEWLDEAVRESIKPQPSEEEQKDPRQIWEEAAARVTKEKPTKEPKESISEAEIPSLILPPEPVLPDEAPFPKPDLPQG